MWAALALSLVVTQDWTAVAPKVGPSVLRLESTSEGEPDTVCSAVIISKNYVLTAAHCVPTKPEGRSLAAGKRHADLVRINYSLDLAVLKVEGLDGPALPLRDSEAPVGTPVMITGYAYGALKPKYTFGWVSEMSDEALIIGALIDATIISGCSGGALCDQQGRLISIVQSSLGSNRGAYLAVAAPPSVVSEFVRPYVVASKAP